VSSGVFGLGMRNQIPSAAFICLRLS
jgi:hypothetical protein